MLKKVTVKDVIQEAHLEMQNEEITQSDREVVDKIESLLTELKGEGISGKNFDMYSEDELSRISGSLAILKMSLGEILARAQKNFSIQTHIIRLKQANTRDRAAVELKAKGVIKPTQGDIKDFIVKVTFSDDIKSSFQEEYVTRLSNYWWALKPLIEVILKRIEVLQTQRGDERKGQNSVEFLDQ